MNELWQLTKFILQTFALMVTDLRYILIIVLVSFVIYRQQVKIREYEQSLFNLKRIHPFTETITALIYGIAGGFLATILFVSLGVSLSDAGVAYLWLAAIVLMFIHPRFLCFSYAGSLVSLVSLLTGYPQIHIATLMALVAILHFVEAALIFVNGYHNPSPMFLKHKSGKVVGGFSLQKFWPMPTIALVGAAIASSGVDWTTISMPDWWPIFHSAQEIPANHTLVHVLFPLVVALGYSDIVQTELPKTKARRTSGQLVLYSLVLLALALLANANSVFLIFPILFASLGHELVIYWGKKQEERQEPIFQCEDGIMVLTVYPNSPAEKMGLDVGDVIKSINGIETPNLPTLVSHISPWIIDPVLVVENQFKEPRRREIHFKGKLPPLGIIPTPSPEQGSYMRLRDGLLKRLWNKWRA